MAASAERRTGDPREALARRGCAHAPRAHTTRRSPLRNPGATSRARPDRDAAADTWRRPSTPSIKNAHQQLTFFRNTRGRQREDRRRQGGKGVAEARHGQGRQQAARARLLVWEAGHILHVMHTSARVTGPDYWSHAILAVTLNLTLNHETLDRVNLDLNLYQRALDGESVSLSRESRALG